MGDAEAKPAAGTEFQNIEPVSDVAPASSDEKDELPSVGRVWEGGGATSIFAAFKKAAPPKAVEQAAPNVQDLGDVDRSDFHRLMQQFMRAAEEQAPTVAGFLEGSKIIAIEGGTLTLEYAKNYEVNTKMLDRNGKRESLQEVLSGLLGEPTGIKFAVSDQELILERPAAPKAQRPPWENKSSAPAPEPTAAAAANQGIPVTEELRTEIMEHNPLIKSIADEFNARIVKIEE